MPSYSGSFRDPFTMTWRDPRNSRGAGNPVLDRSATILVKPGAAETAVLDRSAIIKHQAQLEERYIVSLPL